MTTDQVQAIGPEFTAFLRPFERFFENPKTVQHFRNYSRGLLTDFERKTAEPLAKYAGTAPRCLQQFLKACLWDHEGLTDGVQQALHTAVAELPPDPVGTVGILDETSAFERRDQDARRAAAVPRPWARWPTASSPCIWLWPMARSRPFSTANCSCPNRGTPTGNAAGKRTSLTNSLSAEVGHRARVARAQPAQRLAF